MELNADDGDDDSEFNAELELLSRGGLGAPAEAVLQVLSFTRSKSSRISQSTERRPQLAMKEHDDEARILRIEQVPFVLSGEYPLAAWAAWICFACPNSCA